MSDRAAAIPGLAPYPERRWPNETALDRFAADAVGWLWRAQDSLLPRAAARRFVRRVGAFAPALAGASDEELKERVARLRRLLRLAAAPPPARLAEAFALVREVAWRTIGQRPYDVQIMAGHALLGGRVAEVRTGEGKTLIAALPAVAVALTGSPVHVVTVNEYLAERDAALLRPIYAFFGLSVGLVVSGMSQDARQRAYDCDVTYCTNKELAFDYLRDRLVLRAAPTTLRMKCESFLAGRAGARETALRGLHFAIVDEADSVLVDEARTPLILSRPVTDQIGNEARERALALAGELEEEVDFRILRRERRLALTPRGARRVEARAAEAGGLWGMEVAREELVVQALTALHLFQRDQHYLVADGVVRIIDEYTGRIMADRFWNAGLHQMIEMKEGCDPSPPQDTIARMTYQRFFRRYCRLAGMSGTISEVAGEIWSVYRLRTVRIPTNRPSRLTIAPDRVFVRSEQRCQALAARVRDLHRTGAPVLIGTRSIEASRRISAALDEVGVAHRVLSAEQDRDEAEIVAKAGQPAAVTVATNMAGRGTDIRLGPGVEALGGLHVLMTERHDAGRIDRQLAGRAGRQGEPGRLEAYLSLEDSLLEMDGSRAFAAAARRLMPLLGARAGRLAIRRAQRRAERLHARMRRDLLRSDGVLSDRLAFTGAGE